VQSWDGKTKLYRATLPLGGNEPLGSDQQWMERIKARMHGAVHPEYAESWRRSMRAALKVDVRPDFLFDVNSIMHPAFCADNELRITGWSKAFEDLFGVPNGIDMFTFFRLFDLHVYDSRSTNVDERRHAVDAMREGLAEKGAVNQLPAFLRLSNSYEFLEISCVIQKPYEGVQSIMPISKDLRVMRELRDQEQQFAASLYHDFNSPLFGLSLQLSDLLTGGGETPLSPELKGELQEVLETVTSLQHSLELYRSYPDEGALTVFDPISVVNRVLPVFRVMNSGIHFDESAHKLRDHVGVYLSPGRAYWFQQALRNVVRNAVEAIETRIADSSAPGEISISSTEKGTSDIMISVKDNGCGMKAEVLEELNLNRPYTSKPGPDHGGVGLSILRKVTQMAGGFRPQFDSSPGVGTIVHIPLTVVKSRPHD
jgi:signal transduction histidine kinase